MRAALFAGGRNLFRAGQRRFDLRVQEPDRRIDIPTLFGLFEERQQLPRHCRGRLGVLRPRIDSMDETLGVFLRLLPAFRAIHHAPVAGLARLTAWP